METTEVYMELPSCHHEDAVFWNPDNKVVQCHRCGHIFVPKDYDKKTMTEIQQLVFEEYEKNGYAERWTVEYLTKHPDELELVIDLAEVGLIGTEVAELQEDIRNAAKENYGKECSDIIIRVLNWANRKEFNVEPHIYEKHEINLERGELHGRKV